jgi:hypothetical protein
MGIVAITYFVVGIALMVYGVIQIFAGAVGFAIVLLCVSVWFLYRGRSASIQSFNVEMLSILDDPDAASRPSPDDLQHAKGIAAKNLKE